MPRIQASFLTAVVLVSGCHGAKQEELRADDATKVTVVASAPTPPSPSVSVTKGRVVVGDVTVDEQGVAIGEARVSNDGSVDLGSVKVGKKGNVDVGGIHVGKDGDVTLPAAPR